MLQSFPLFPGTHSWCISGVALGRCRCGSGVCRALPVSLHVAAARGLACLLRQVRSLFKSAGPMGAAPFKRAAVGRVSHGNPAACHSRLKRLLGFPGIGWESSNYWLIRSVLPWSPATSTESRSAPARLIPWEVLSTSPRLVSVEPTAPVSRGCPGDVASAARGAMAGHGLCLADRNGLESCSPKALTLSSSLLASASLSWNNMWLHRAGELESTLKSSCRSQGVLLWSARCRIPRWFCTPGWAGAGIPVQGWPEIPLRAESQFLSLLLVGFPGAASVLL